MFAFHIFGLMCVFHSAEDFLASPNGSGGNIHYMFYLGHVRGGGTNSGRVQLSQRGKGFFINNF